MIEWWQYLAAIFLFGGFLFLIVAGFVVGILGCIGLYYGVRGAAGWLNGR